ncbi:Disease resistance protein (TIR-NBS class) [Abeliophyllum distichum]|uniref:Disease resistance protein (TIR-NBS class) n=1 Tax=Abeliophyllum distichum TaxID=126358 RepID=A0ABD1TVJ4_9LAMI
MDLQEDSSIFGSLPNMTSRNLSSSSSTFFSANQSLSPKLLTCTNIDSLDTSLVTAELESLASIKYASLDVYPFAAACTSNDDLKFNHVSSSTCISNCTLSSYGIGRENNCSRHSKLKKIGKLLETSAPPTSFSSNRLRSCDVYVGFHGRKPSLLRLTNWLRAELEIQGLSCFVTDRARCRNSRKHSIAERAMDGCTFGGVILTRKSFRNPYTIEEIRFFSSKKNLVPIYFDLGPDDCLVRDIIEKRGELWEKHGGELWLLYGGLETEWKDAVTALSRAEEWKLEAHDGKLRDCILRAVTLLALRLGRRSVVDRLTKWRENAEKEEFPFPPNENFIGRRKELSELEFMLFGDVSGDAERDYFELKARSQQKNLTIGSGRGNSVDEKRRDPERERSKRKGKEPIVWKESEKEIEMQSTEFFQPQQHTQKVKNIGKQGRRRRSMKVVYGKGIACVSGESGIGKTELILEFAYRFYQRYKMVLWIGGESRYLRQNYLNLWPFLEVDVGVENYTEKSQTKSFEDQEEAAIARIRKELMRNIPFLVIIDNLESEKDWEVLRISRLPEIDALRVIEEKLGRLTLGLAIVGAVLSELPINPSRLLDTINRIPSRDVTWSGRENKLLRRNTFLLQLFEVCFSIFDNVVGPRSLATRMVLASGWFAPAQIPVSILALAACKIPEKHPHQRLWKNILCSLTCGFTSSYAQRSRAEASSLLFRFNIARSCTKEGYIQFNNLIKLYARKRGIAGVAQATVQAIISRGSINHHSDHIWAACFLLLGFGKDPIAFKVKVSELLFLAKEVILPLAIQTFNNFSRCSAALELLRLCTDELETADQAFLTPVENWFDKSLCWKQIQTQAQLNPCLWQDLALTRATVLETRAQLMIRGGQFDIGDDLIRKAIFIRTSICGENHPQTISAQETLTKVTRLLADIQTQF